MLKRVPGAVVAAIIALLTLIVLPIAINIGTGGTPPKTLKHYEKFSWPVVLGCGFLILLFTLVKGLRKSRATSAGNKTHPRNRVRALAQVQSRINGRLERSLSQRARIELTVADSPGSIVPPVHLMVGAVSTIDDRGLVLTDINQAFEESDQSLLILGGPGSGKTTMLLELAQSLHDKALADQNLAVPVVVDLARWSTTSAALPTRPNTSTKEVRDSAKESLSSDGEPADPVAPRPQGGPRRLISSRREGGKFGVSTGQEHDFHHWLIRELNYLYKIPGNVTEEWLKSRGLILLLDGLDEVSPSDRDRCLEAINKFQEFYNVPAMAVASRKADYEKLKGRLSLQKAVQIQPLTQHQISQYLSAAGDRLMGVREALKQDATLWQLLDSPLMLNVMVLAYHDRPARQVIEGTTLGDRRSRLITAYVDEVTTRRNAPIAKYTLAETQLWLAQLAYSASVHRSDMPIRRTWFGWRMTWYSNAPESRVRLLFSATFPWVVGLSCSIGAILAMVIRLGKISALAAAVALLALQCSYVGFTFPVRRRRHARVMAYPRLRRNGIIAGGISGALEFGLFSILFGHEGTLNEPVRWLVIVCPLICAIGLGARFERSVPAGFVESLWWGVLIGGVAACYVLYRWHPDRKVLTFTFTVGFVTTLVIAYIGFVAYFVINQPDHFRLISKHLDWRSMVPPIALTGVALLVTPYGTSEPVMSAMEAVIGCFSGETIGIMGALILVVGVGSVISPYKLALSGIDQLPFRFTRFLDYAVDRSLLYKEKRGYAFIHTIFQEYFVEMYRKHERSWAAKAYTDDRIPDPPDVISRLKTIEEENDYVSRLHRPSSRPTKR